MWLVAVTFFIASFVGEIALDTEDQKLLRRVQVLALCDHLLQTLVIWLMLNNPRFCEKAFKFNDSDYFLYGGIVVVACFVVYHQFKLLRIMFNLVFGINSISIRLQFR